VTHINIHSLPIKAGLVGTGFAAKLRAEALQADERSHLVAVSGYTQKKRKSLRETTKPQL
jgi:biliverdin reductase